MHFTIEELYASATAKAKGIDNKPSTQQMINLVYLAAYVLEPLRVAMKEPIKIGSGFRCERLNKAVGGVYNSQHMKGQAADLCIDGDIQKGRKWFNYIKNHLPFDQLIWEHNSKGTYWVHVSFVYPDFGKNRHKVIDDLLKK
ncbi:MAG: peptidase M15 [Prevotella sp.]|nr:peptidase M15 [Prevotella sp.]